SANGGRTVTALRLSNGIGGAWDTVSPNAAWLLGVATSLDGPLLNDITTMAVNTTVADGGSLRLFASDYGGGLGFGTGRTLTIIATLADGTVVQASTNVTSTTPIVSAVAANEGTSGAAVPGTVDGSTFRNGAAGRRPGRRHADADAQRGRWTDGDGAAAFERARRRVGHHITECRLAPRRGAFAGRGAAE